MLESRPPQLLVGAILLIVVFGAGFIMGNYSASDEVNIVNDATKPTTNVNPKPTATSTIPAATKIETSNLTEGQIKLMKALGVDPTKVTITPTMVACAETSLGSARVEEIKNGATPSIIEGGKLVVCYNK